MAQEGVQFRTSPARPRMPSKPPPRKPFWAVKTEKMLTELGPPSDSGPRKRKPDQLHREMRRKRQANTPK